MLLAQLESLSNGALELFGGEVHLPRASSVRWMSSGYQQLASDYYWLSAVQYFGTQENRLRDYADLPKYLDLVRELDSRFCYPYVFAGEVVPFHRPDGQWSNTAEAIRLLQPGLETCPADWRIPFQLGYALFTFTDRYGEAADDIAKASKIPGAPRFLSSLASRLYGQQGDLETALAFAKILTREEATDPFSRRELENRLLQIELELDLRSLRHAAEAFSGRKGRPPATLPDLKEAGLISEVPSDPLGGSFFIRPDGTVGSRHEDQLLRMFVGKGLHLHERVPLIETARCVEPRPSRC